MGEPLRDENEDSSDDGIWGHEAGSQTEHCYGRDTEQSSCDTEAKLNT